MITTAIVLLSLWPLRIVAYRVLTRFRPETERLMAQLPSGESPAPLIGELEGLGAKLQAVQVSQEADRRTLLLEVTLPPRADAPGIVAKLAELDNVLEIHWAD